MEVFTDRDEGQKEAYETWVNRFGELMEDAPSVEVMITTAIAVIAQSRHIMHVLVSEQPGPCNCERIWSTLFQGKLAAAMAGQQGPMDLHDGEVLALDVGMAMALAAPDEVVAELKREYGINPPSAFLYQAALPLMNFEGQEEFQQMLEGIRDDIQLRASFLDTMTDFGIEDLGI